MDFADDPFARK
jgi:hypothetical protein